MKNDFVLGVDLDGVCADFYGRMREVMAEWRGVEIESLTEEVSYGLPEWGLVPHEYDRLHRFAVTQREFFTSVEPISGAPQSLRRLGTEGIRIRIITHRLFIRYFHKVAVVQTVQWLDQHGIPYWDLCFMRDKSMVDATMYVEDTPSNIEALQACGKDVIAFTNSTNRDMDPAPYRRADNWHETEELIRERYYSWRRQRGLRLPQAPGHQPPDTESPPVDFPSPRAV